MVLALHGLHNLCVGLVAQGHELVVSLSVGVGSLLFGVGDVVLLREQTELVLQELLGILVALSGDGLLESLANGRGPCLVGACQADSAVDGVLHLGIHALCRRLQHGGKHGDGLRRSLYKGLQLVVEIGLLLDGHQGKHVLHDGLCGALACILCKGGQAEQQRGYNNI